MLCTVSPESGIVRRREPVMVPDLEPVIVPARDPVIVPVLLVRDPVIVPPTAIDEIERINASAIKVCCERPMTFSS